MSGAFCWTIDPPHTAPAQPNPRFTRSCCHSAGLAAVLRLDCRYQAKAAQQDEADRNYGRKMREKEAKEGRERKKQDEKCRKDPDECD